MRKIIAQAPIGERYTGALECIASDDAYHGTSYALVVHEYVAALTASRAALLAALEQLHDETADYITINKLGHTHHSQSMREALAAIKNAKEIQK